MFKSIELSVGVFVGIGLAALFMLAMQASNLASLNNDGSYEITARFDNIGGLKVRSAVKVSGVKVGEVSAIDYDTEMFEAVVTMQVDDQYQQFPRDTIASIFTSGLLGEQYVSLEPGGDEKLLGNQSEIRHTQSAMVLEQLIGQFIFNQGSDKKDDNSPF
ncbi:MAG: outer membrane lipid asymmetry maintenance protein MlaD [Gammaproteobacteria bacterium]|nr:outer membrane lipid asymmetry maintenance protein MlaD [Gammaproteobacteria bacterium]